MLNYVLDYRNQSVQQISLTDIKNHTDNFVKLIHKQTHGADSFYEILYLNSYVRLFFDVDDVNNTDDILPLIRAFKSLGECSICGYYKDEDIYNGFKEALDTNDYFICKPSAKKHLSFHVVYFNMITTYTDLNKAFSVDKKAVKDPLIEKYRDKSVYSKNRLFRHVAFNKNEQRIGILNDGLPRDIFLKQFIQTDQNINFDIESITENTPTDTLLKAIDNMCIDFSDDDFNTENTNKNTNKNTNENTNENTNKNTNENTNKNTNKNTNENTNENTNKNTNENTNKNTNDIAACVRKSIQMLLVFVCDFTGHVNTFKDIVNYIPNNELTSYGSDYFRQTYTQLYNLHEHHTKENLTELFKNLPNTCGMCSVLTRLFASVMKAPDEQQSDLLRAYNLIERYYLYHYNTNNSTASAMKYTTKYATYNIHKLLTMYDKYKWLYLHKILFVYKHDYLFKYSNDEYMTLSKSQLNTSSHPLLQFKIDNRFDNTLRVINTLNKQNNQHDNYDMLNLNHITQPLNDKLLAIYADLFSRFGYEITTIENMFEVFESILFGETFEDEHSGQLARDIVYYDIINKFTKPYNIVVCYYGKGGEGKTSEYNLLANIINNKRFTTICGIEQFDKEQLKPLLSKKLICIEELPKDNKRYNKLIDSIKRYSGGAVVSLRSMYKDDEDVHIDCRFRINTNNETMLTNMIKQNVSAIKRRFFIAKRIVKNPQHTQLCGILCNDKQFAINYARWVYNNNKQPVYNINDSQTMSIFNENSIIYKEVLTDDRTEFVNALDDTCYKNKNGAYQIVESNAFRLFKQYMLDNYNKKLTLKTFKENYLNKYCKVINGKYTLDYSDIVCSVDYKQLLINVIDYNNYLCLSQCYLTKEDYQTKTNGHYRVDVKRTYDAYCQYMLSTKGTIKYNQSQFIAAVLNNVCIRPKNYIDSNGKVINNTTKPYILSAALLVNLHHTTPKDEWIDL